MKRDAWIFDVDGTLANVDSILHHVKNINDEDSFDDDNFNNFDDININHILDKYINKNFPKINDNIISEINKVNNVRDIYKLFMPKQEMIQCIDFLDMKDVLYM